MEKTLKSRSNEQPSTKLSPTKKLSTLQKHILQWKTLPQNINTANFKDTIKLDMNDAEREGHLKTIFQAYSTSQGFIVRPTLEYFANALTEAMSSPDDK